MNEFEQVPFGADDFADNPEPRCPCLLLLDNSGSMGGEPIAQLNDGLRAFKEELMADPLAAKRVEVGIVTFGPVKIEQDFQTADMFQPPHLTAQADTPMGAAITQGLDLIRRRKEVYRSNGISYYRPWIFLVTDGGPTDSWHHIPNLIREGVASKSFAFFPVGVRGANMSVLSQMAADNAPLQLDGLRFRDMFTWLSNSLGSVSHSQPGDAVALTNPMGPTGWASV